MHILKLITIVFVALCFERIDAIEQRAITLPTSLEYMEIYVETYVMEKFDEGWELHLVEIEKDPNIQKSDYKKYEEKKKSYFNQFVEPFIHQCLKDIKNNGTENIVASEAKVQSLGRWAETVSSAMSLIVKNNLPDDAITRLYQTYIDYNLKTLIGPWVGPAWDPSKILDPHVY
jgi:hypothetical protein